MKNKTFDPALIHHITIADCPGDLVINGGGETLIIHGDSYETAESKAGIAITGQGDLVLNVPATATLVVAACRGDLVMNGVLGSADVQETHGDMALNRVGTVTVGTVRGDLAAKDVGGELRIATIVEGDVAVRRVGSFFAHQVQGDLQVRYSAGAVEVETVNGDVDISRANEDVTVDNAYRDASVSKVNGRATVRTADGDIRISGPFGTGKHHFTAKGDIVVRWPAEAPVKIVATTPNFRDRLGLKDLSEEGNTHTGHVGDDAPDTTLVLEAGGRIILKESRSVDRHWMKFEIGEDFNFDMDLSELEGLGEQISSVITDRVADLESRLGVELAAKVEARAHRAAERAEKAIERALRKAERGQRSRHQRVWDDAPEAPAPAKSAREKKANSEEQMHVLKMLEQGKITPQEAFTLLDALE